MLARTIYFMALNMGESLAAALEAYWTNASYAEDNDVAKAKLFATACRRLIGITPSEVQHASRFTTKVDTKQIPAMLARVEDWLVDNAVSATGNVIGYSLQDFR